MKPSFLSFSFLFVLACQSSLSSRPLVTTTAIGETYASFARQRIEASNEGLLHKLENASTLDAQTTNELLTALEDWRETLSLFVHVFPKTLGQDPVLEMLQDAESGILLIESSSDEDAIMWWIQLMIRSLRSEESLAYLGNLNEAFATRRTISALPLYYWSDVNFIPALAAGVDSNFQDYLRQQKNALRKAMAKVLSQDPLFPDQEHGLEAILARTHILLRIDAKYRFTDEDALFRKELRSTRGFCEAALRDLRDHGRMREAKDEGKASILSSKIKRDWQAEQARGLSRAQTERDHEHGRD